MKRRSLLKLIFGFSLVVVLAVSIPLMSGCTSPTAAPEPTPAPEPAPAPEPEPEPVDLGPIKIGAPLPLTGWAAADGQGYFQGLTFAVDEINAQGGLLGRPVEIVLFDTKDFAPETLKLAADQMVGVDGVDMASGGWSGWGGDVTAFGKYDIPYFEYDGSESSLQTIAEPGNNNVFQGSDNEYNSGVDSWNFMMELPYDYPNNKVALIGTDDAWGTGVVEGIRDLALENGWEVPIYEIVPYGTVEWGTILAKVRKEEPAWLHLEVVSPPDIIAFFNQFMEDPTPTLLNYGYSMSPPDFGLQMGADADGILGWAGGYVGFPPPTQEVADWFAAFELKFGNEPSAGAPWMYNSFMMWAEAVRQVGDPADHDAVVAWLETNVFQSMPGMRVINFGERHVTPHAEFAGVYVQIQDGGQWNCLYHNVYGNPYVDYQGNSYEFQIPSWIE